MQASVILRAMVFITGLSAPTAAISGILVSAPIDVIGNLPVAQFTSLGYGTNTYKDWGNEPFVAVDPTNTKNILVSSFAYSTNSTTIWCERLLLHQWRSELDRTVFDTRSAKRPHDSQ